MRSLQVLFLSLVVCMPAYSQESVLRWKFEPGDSESYRLTQTADLDLTLESGRNVHTKVERKLEWLWRVEEIESDGSASIAIKVTGVRLLVSGPTGEQTLFDSKSKDEPRGFAATLAPLFRTLMKSEIRAPMTPLGEVDPNQMLLPENLQIVINTKPVGKAVGTIASKGDLLPLINLTMPELPEVSVESGRKWQLVQSKNAIPFGAATESSEYHLESLADPPGERVAKIIASSKVGFLEDDADKPAPRITKQDCTGTIVFDLEAGRPKSHTSSQTLELETHGGRQSATGKLVHELRLEVNTEKAED